MEIKIDSTYKGTRILFADTAKRKRKLLNDMMNILEAEGFQEMMIPIIQKQETFQSKVGGENQKMMYTFKDQGDRDLCLAPEYTAVVMQLANQTFKMQKDIKLFYIGECFRGERNQRGRWRQFTQFGIEIINPSKDYLEYLVELTKRLIELVTDKYEVSQNVIRGLEYYNDWTMEITCEDLGAAKQVCGGGSYVGGIGAAIGIDRLLLL